MHPAMRDLPMTAPTFTGCSIFLVSCYKAIIFGLGHLLHMASYTIVLDHFLRAFSHKNHFWFRSGRKYRCVVQPIHGLKIVGIQHIVLRYMAPITRNPFPMGTVHPTIVYRGHYMTIDTRLGVIGKVGNHLSFFHQKQTKPYNASYQNYGCNTPI